MTLVAGTKLGRYEIRAKLGAGGMGEVYLGEDTQLYRKADEMLGESLSEAHWIAKIYATLNEKELALTWLERGFAAGAIGVFTKDDPVWDPIRSDRRFADLKRMGIPQ